MFASSADLGGPRHLIAGRRLTRPLDLRDGDFSIKRLSSVLLEKQIYEYVLLKEVLPHPRNIKISL